MSIVVFCEWISFEVSLVPWRYIRHQIVSRRRQSVSFLIIVSYSHEYDFPNESEKSTSPS